MTNVASALTIEQCATVFVFILSVVMLDETLSIFKVCAVAVCIAGVVLTAFGDDKAGGGTVSAKLC